MLNFMKKNEQDLPMEEIDENTYPDSEAGYNDPAPESNVELQTFIVKPDAAKTFAHIHKDLTLSYLNEGELVAIRTHGDVVNLCDHLGFETAKKVFLHDMFVMLNSARSRKGFERKMVATNIHKHISERAEEKKKRWGF